MNAKIWIWISNTIPKPWAGGQPQNPVGYSRAMQLPKRRQSCNDQTRLRYIDTGQTDGWDRHENTWKEICGSFCGENIFINVLSGCCVGPSASSPVFFSDKKGWLWPKRIEERGDIKLNLKTQTMTKMFFSKNLHIWVIL